MEKKICPKCSSPKWMTGIETLREGEVALAVRRPDRKNRAVGYSRVHAEVCGECGYIEFFLDAPSEFYEEWRKHNA